MLMDSTDFSHNIQLLAKPKTKLLAGFNIMSASTISSYTFHFQHLPE